jgi:hypothetical protein
VSLASRGLRDMDDGPQPILDPGALSAVHRQAGRIHLQAAVVTAVVTAAALLPG